MANDVELSKLFIWSKTRTNLSKLLKEYSLPQIVRVVEAGFSSKHEYTNLHEGQILSLHEIRSVRKLIATDSSDTQVTITLSCPAHVFVCPSNCKYIACKVENFKSILPNIQYVRVKSQGLQLRNNDSALKVGDILQIQKIDKKKKIVLCRNTDTREDITLSYKSAAIFTPLLDCRKYTPSEVVTKYGMPSRVYFVGTRSQGDQTSDEWNSALARLTEVVFHKEVTEVKVIATVLGEGVGELMHCIDLPTDLPIRCRVAEGFSQSSGSYEDFVRSLHAGFDKKSFLERANVFQEISRANKHDSSKSTTTFSRQQADSLPKLVRSIVATSHPQDSPDPNKTTIMNDLAKSPKDSEYPLSDPKQSLQTPPEDSTSTTECNYVQTENKKENGYKKASCEKQNISLDNQSDLSVNVKNPHLTRIVNAPPTPDVQKPQCIPEINPRDSDGSYEEVNIIEPQCNRLKLINSRHSGSYEEVNIMEPHRNPFKINSGSYEEVNIMEPQRNRVKINSSRSNGYEEVKPVWNSNFKHEFAVPSVILNKQSSDVHSDYDIPTTSSKLQPQTPKFADPKLVFKKQLPNSNLVLNKQLSNKDSVYAIPIKASNLQRQAKKFKHEFADPSSILNKQLCEVHSDYVIPTSKLQRQAQKFADPKLVLNKQLPTVDSDYVIVPMISSNLQPQSQKFENPNLTLKQNDGQLCQTIPIFPPNIEPQSQQFANPNLVLNEQLSKEDSDHIPITASNLQRQPKKFVIHKQTDRKGKSIHIYENGKGELPDKHVYEDMNPKLE